MTHVSTAFTLEYLCKNQSWPKGVAKSPLPALEIPTENEMPGCNPSISYEKHTISLIRNSISTFYIDCAHVFTQIIYKLYHLM